jgi:flagellar protein FlaD
MAKSSGLFKKKGEEKPSPREIPKDSSVRSVKEKKVGALSEALKEIEAEDKTAKSSRKLFQETNRLEDELIQYLNEKPRAEEDLGIPDLEEPTGLKINLDEYTESEDQRARRSTPESDLIRIDTSQGQKAAEPISEPHERKQIRIETRPERMEPPAAPPVPGNKAALDNLEEDSIYDMIQTQTFERVPPAARRSSRQPEEAVQVQRRTLKSPPPMVVSAPAEKVIQAPDFSPVLKDVQMEPLRGESMKIFTAAAPILSQIRHDYLSVTLALRWVEYLLERVTRDKLSLVMDFYRDVGWISDGVRTEILAYARGEMQDVTKYQPHEDEISDESPEFNVSPVAVYKKVDDWRLSADDHLKSLIFIMKMAGMEVDKDKLNSLEQTIKQFKDNLQGFYGI